MAPAEAPDQAAQELLRLARKRFDKLSKAEAKLLRAAPKGKWAVCGPSGELDDPSNDPAKADGWGPERQVRAELLRWVCIDSAAGSHVDPKGIRLLGAKVTGPLDLSFATVPFSLGLYHCLVSDETNLMSARLPALYLNGSRTLAVTADGAIVAASVFLRGGFAAEGEVRLLGAQIGGNLDCSGGTFMNPPREGLPESGTALSADGAKVKGSVFLRGGFTAEGEVRLLGAQIGGDLACSGGVFRNPPQKDIPQSGKALNADRVNAHRGVFLGEGFTAEGEVRLLGAQIGGNLDCSGGTFMNPPREGLPESGKALSADGVKVKRDVLLRDGFAAEGKVRLLGAQFGGNLDCSGGTFKNPPREKLPESGKALSADGVHVKGSAFLCDGFTAEGEVRLLGAQVGGNLACSGGTFKNPPREGLPASGKALSADGLTVGRGVFLRKGFTAQGEVRLPGTQIGGDLDCEGRKLSALNAQGAKVTRHLVLCRAQDAKNADIDLRNTSADALIDDEESWPAEGNLYLDGFVYGRISGGPTDAEARLRWLALQPEFKPQPYRQLAKVLREMGDDRGARRVLYEMERLARGETERSWFERIWMRIWNSIVDRFGPLGRWLLKWTIGYGHYPLRALLWLAILTMLGTALFGLGYLGGAMTPTEREAYAYFERQGWPPRHHQQFNPLIYSLENSVPLLRLGQDSAWAPDPGPRGQEHPGTVNFAPLTWLARAAARWHFTWLAPPGFLRFVRWAQIILGWMLATLFVAGVTGVVRRE